MLTGMLTFFSKDLRMWERFGNRWENKERLPQWCWHARAEQQLLQEWHDSVHLLSWPFSHIRRKPLATARKAANYVIPRMTPVKIHRCREKGRKQYRLKHLDHSHQRTPTTGKGQEIFTHKRPTTDTRQKISSPGEEEQAYWESPTPRAQAEKGYIRGRMEQDNRNPSPIPLTISSPHTKK